MLIFCFKSQLILITTCQLEWRRCQGSLQKCLLTLITSDCRSTRGLLVCNPKGTNLLISIPPPKNNLWFVSYPRKQSHKWWSAASSWGFLLSMRMPATSCLVLHHFNFFGAQSWRAVDEPTKTSEHFGDRHLHEEVSYNSLIPKTSQWWISDVKGWNHHVFLPTSPVCCILWMSKQGKHVCLRNISPGKTKDCQRI